MPYLTLRRRPRLVAAAVGAVICTVTLSSCAPAAGPAPDSSTSPAGVTTVSTGLTTPWSIVFLDDGTPLVSERDTGRIVQLADDGTAREVTDIDQAVHNGEGGLLGLAVHDSRLYAAVTTATDNRVIPMPVTRQGEQVVLGPAQTVIDGLPSASYHNGGRVAFGPDGMLYVTAGDAGRSDTAQDRAALGGKILRLQPDGSIPADNPFPGSPVYSLGHRNPQGIAWGPDGTMYAAEFGQDTWDELNVISPGHNYGWPAVEGTADDDRFTDPVQQWHPQDASPSGITIDRDRIVIANLRGQQLRAIPLDDLTTGSTLLAGEGRLRDVAVAPDGDLWVITSNTDGRGTPAADDDRVLRLDSDARPR